MSLGVLIHELNVLYAAFRAGAADPLPPQPASPDTTATPPATGEDSMKGVLERLNALPPEPEQPDGLQGEQPPEMPAVTTPPAETPREDEILE